MAEHTPTPWKISPVRTTEDTAMIVGGKGFEFGLIADVTEDFDASFIIKAANNHDALVEALKNVQALISEAAMTGFNCKDGDWAERLFASQQMTSKALRALVQETGER